MRSAPAGGSGSSCVSSGTAIGGPSTGASTRGGFGRHCRRFSDKALNAACWVVGKKVRVEEPVCAPRYMQTQRWDHYVLLPVTDENATGNKQSVVS